MSDYDFIIAGGGTAGCILANRLSADGKYRVLMLEAGHEARSPWIGIPAGFSKLLVDPDYNWRFSTEPEDNVHGRRIAVPRGKGVGGSTLINGMIYARPAGGLRRLGGGRRGGLELGPGRAPVPQDRML